MACYEFNIIRCYLKKKQKNSGCLREMNIARKKRKEKRTEKNIKGK